MELATEAMPWRAPRTPGAAAPSGPWGEFLQRFLVAVADAEADAPDPAEAEGEPPPGR